MTGLDLIKQALRMIGIIEGEGTPSGAEGADALRCLNQMIDEWNTQGLIPYTQQSNTFNVTANTVNYTIGSGQTWNMARPVRIDSAYVTSGGVDYPMKQLTYEEYKMKPYKTNVTTSIPSEFVYIENYPYGTVTIWAVPTANMTMTIVTPVKLSQVTLAGAISLPEGYESALKYNLALELATEYLIDPKPTLIARAMESKANIKRLNCVEKEEMCFDAGISTVRGVYNINSDMYL
jgi:hypothetical protein